MEQKEAIDPRMLTTPAGAAVGWALARKIYGTEGTHAEQLAGAGLGGGAGYLGGELIRGSQPELAKVDSSDPKGAARSLLRQADARGGDIDVHTDAFIGAAEAAGAQVLPKNYNLDTTPGTAEDYHRRRIKPYVKTIQEKNTNTSGARILQQLARKNEETNPEYTEKLRAGARKLERDAADKDRELPSRVMTVVKTVWDMYMGADE